MRNRLISLFVAASIIFAAASPAYAADGKGYYDVPAESWFAEAVTYCNENGFMNGTAEGTFSPDATMTRAMLAVVLYRMAGSPETGTGTGFTDVPTGKWYTIPIAWASQNGIVGGYGNGRFGTDDPVSGQDLITILWRYAGSPKPESTDTSLDTAIYASQPISWAKENSIIGVSGGVSFEPKANITRAQIADILMRYSKGAKAQGDAQSSGSSQPEPGKPENMVFIQGGSFTMGSPGTEDWRGSDETAHTVNISSFYISPYELTQKEYADVTGKSPSNFNGDKLPVESISWLDAVTFCNLKSEAEGLSPAYRIEGRTVYWERSANGYRLPTEAEWEYACRAGSNTPFGSNASPSTKDANYYGQYQGGQAAQGTPVTCRQTTVAVDSFSPNAFGLYNMHGNVSEWVWDTYGAYVKNGASDPTGAANGRLKVYRGGGWDDFAKHMRSAFRGAAGIECRMANLGMRLVRNAGSGVDGIVTYLIPDEKPAVIGKMLIAYFSGSGNTRGIAREIQKQTGADMVELTCESPYSSDYNTLVDESQRDQRIQARPKLTTHVENMEGYDIVMLGYPVWWASVPMPIASFLDGYDFSGKTILPFASFDYSGLGQSLSDISKLAPEATMGGSLAVQYSGEGTIKDKVSVWLKANGILSGDSEAQ